MITSHTNSKEIQNIKTINHTFQSRFLKRDVKIDVYLSDFLLENEIEPRILYINDGQDMVALKLVENLEMMYQTNDVLPLIIVAIHASQQRMNEYGVASKADYRSRGNKAGNYKKFVIGELMPFISNNYNLIHKADLSFFCGFSLGGLSAFDIGFAQPELFSKIGVFSGSFWWRSKSLTNPSFNEKTDRIIHQIVKNGRYNPGQKFWFEVGTDDEKIDRNNNGIIDAIDDT